MVGFEILVQVDREKRHEFLQACELLSKTEGRNLACTSQTLYEAIGESNTFLWVEHWSESKAMSAHLASERFRVLLGAIEVLGELGALRKMTIDPVQQ